MNEELFLDDGIYISPELELVSDQPSVELPCGHGNACNGRDDYFD